MTTNAILLDVGPAVSQPPAPVLRDPRTVACPYRGHRYAVACAAQPGQPCRDARGMPWTEVHAERRAAAGEEVPTYEERFGHEDKSPEMADEPEDSEATDP